MSFSLVFPAAIDEWAKSTDMNRFAKCIPIIRGRTSAAIPLDPAGKGA